MEWKSVVMSTKNVEAGEFIGYGNTYQTSRKQKIATVPIGYSHGFGRNLTNAGIVLIRGRRAGVAGLVNMNLLTIDVTDIPDVKKGDEVVIIGKQGDQEMTVSSFSEMTNFLNYEVLVRIPSQLPRHLVE
jgi:alanine racemase